MLKEVECHGIFDFVYYVEFEDWEEFEEELKESDVGSFGYYLVKRDLTRSELPEGAKIWKNSKKRERDEKKLLEKWEHHYAWEHHYDD